MLAYRMVRAWAALKLAAGCGLLAVSSALVTTDVTARYTVPKLGLRPAEPGAQSLHLYSTGTAQDLAPARQLQRYLSFVSLSLSPSPSPSTSTSPLRANCSGTHAQSFGLYII